MTNDFWVHDLSPFLVRFSENFGIRYYGLAYVVAFLIGAFLLRLYWTRGKSQIAPQIQPKLMTAVIIGVFVGGRLGFFLFYSPRTLIGDPLALFRVWEGGMSSHGGFLGVAAAVFWSAQKYKLEWRSTADILATLAGPGLFLGRAANFINGELWGKVANVPWAVIFPKSAPVGTPITEIPPRHPSQLYEAALEGLLLAVYTQVRFWRRTPLSRGRVAGEFLVIYAFARAFCELFREPDAPLLFGLSRGTFFSLFLVIGGVILILTSLPGREETA